MGQRLPSGVRVHSEPPSVPPSLYSCAQLHGSLYNHEDKEQATHKVCLPVYGAFGPSLFLIESLRDSYIKKVKTNAKALAAGLRARGHEVATDGTDNHLLLWDLRPRGLTGSKMEKLLEACSISANKVCLRLLVAHVVNHARASPSVYRYMLAPLCICARYRGDANLTAEAVVGVAVPDGVGL